MDSLGLQTYYTPYFLSCHGWLTLDSKIPTNGNVLLLLCCKHTLNTNRFQLLNPILHLSRQSIYLHQQLHQLHPPSFIYVSLPFSQYSLFSSLHAVSFWTYHPSLPNPFNSHLYSNLAIDSTPNNNTTTNTKDPRIHSPLSYENCLSSTFTSCSVHVLSFPQE